MSRKAKWFWGTICFCVAAAMVVSFCLKRPILMGMGRFMAPGASLSDVEADVAILEGTEFISRSMVSMGMELLASGRVKKIAIVLHRIARNHRPFAFDEEYPSSVKMRLQQEGLKDSAFQIIVTHVHDPVTLTAAKGALDILSRDGIKSAILVSSGFHLRRSALVYQRLSTPLNIKIYPVACFDRYDVDDWWNRDYGPRDFVSESAKLIIYLAKGLIPFRLSCATNLPGIRFVT